jgi:wyosine [tRNA(Phe)-imidazoG37] synthetase (radical SAM superfamily)
MDPYTRNPVSHFMADTAPMDIAFGPVPSRRLGRSLGINNIPPKVCTYSCVYCQLGRTAGTSDLRREFYPPVAVVAAVEAKVREVQRRGEQIDFLTFAPDGEPTLDLHLGVEIRGLRHLGPKVAVISNGSLLHLEEVRGDLASADWVSLKLDAADDHAWRTVDRPHRLLKLDPTVTGMLAFRDTFAGELVTETMLVSGLNDTVRQVEALAAFLRSLRPAIAYLAVPTRPPAESWVRAPDEDTVNRAYQIVAREVDWVELLTGYEGNAFSSTGNSEEDILSITAVHPMKEEAVQDLLRRNGDRWATTERLVNEGRLMELNFEGQRYYLRRLP